MRNCDQFQVRPSDVTNILEWEQNQGSSVEIPFHPARVILQDFTYVCLIYSWRVILGSIVSENSNDDIHICLCGSCIEAFPQVIVKCGTVIGIKGVRKPRGYSACVVAMNTIVYLNL